MSVIDDARMSLAHTHERTDGCYSRPHSRRVRGEIKDEHVRRSRRRRGKSPTGRQSHTSRALLTYFTLSILFSALRSTPFRSFSPVASLHSCVAPGLKIIIRDTAISLVERTIAKLRDILFKIFSRANVGEK